MSILVTCGHCSKTYEVPDEFAGREFRCRDCGGSVTIPGAAPASVAATPALPAAVPVLVEQPAVVESKAVVRPEGEPRPEVTKQRTVTSARTTAAAAARMREMPSTILLAVVLSGIHLLEDLFLIVVGLSLGREAIGTAAVVLLAAGTRLGVEIYVLSGLFQRRRIARLLFLVLSAVGLGSQIWLAVSMAVLSGKTIESPQIDSETLQTMAGLLFCWGTVGSLLRILDIAAIAPRSAGEWCDAT